MARLWHSVAFRLALICGGLMVASIVLLSAIFYFGTVGVLAGDADRKIVVITQRLSENFEHGNTASLAEHIAQSLSDGVDSDTEIYLLTDPAGRKIAGNIAVWTDGLASMDRVIDHPVIREGKPTVGRLLLHRLMDGSLLIVGRDMSDLNEIRDLIGHAIAAGSLMTLLLAVVGTLIFRDQIERRIFAIRHAASDIEAGNLSRRIPLSSEPDEFDRLSADINRMLDRIEELMDGVRNVSNIVAHHLRTPLGRIRGHLEEALRGAPTLSNLAAAGNFAIEELDSLVIVFDKLLQIAEAESGTRRQPFQAVALDEVVATVVELYDAAAEIQGARISAEILGHSVVFGDKDLLACALTNLLDNALKYGGASATIVVRLTEGADGATLVVQDDGPGIPEQERTKVLQRFYRLDRQKQGHGLGMSIIAAIAHLHGGMFHLEDAKPGLRAKIVLPLLSGATLPISNLSDTSRTGSTA